MFVNSYAIQRQRVKAVRRHSNPTVSRKGQKRTSSRSVICTAISHKPVARHSHLGRAVAVIGSGLVLFHNLFEDTF